MLRVLLILITFQLATSSSQADEINPLWFGVEITDYSPYYYMDEGQRYKGAARDIFDLFSNSMNTTAHYQAMPVRRLFNEFLEGNIDLKFPDNPLWSVDLKGDTTVFYSKPVFSVRESLLILEQAEGEIAAKDIEKVGTILGFTVPGIANNLSNNEFEAIRIKKIEQLIHMLVSKRIQAVYFNENVALSLAKDMYPNKNLKRHSKFPAFKYAYHLSSIKHPQLIKKFNQFLNSHAEKITKIKHHYGLK